MIPYRFQIALLLGALAFWPIQSLADNATDDPISFSAQIAPILQARCVTCHGPKLAESDYRMDSFAALNVQTSSDLQALVAGKPEDGELFQRLVHEDEDVRMPAEADRLPEKEIALIRKWIAQGAIFDGDSPDKSFAELLPTVEHPKAPTRYRAAIPISAIATDADSRRIFVGGYHEITVWNEAGELLDRLRNQGQRTYSIDLHPEKPWLLTASGTPGIMGEVRLFNLETGKVTAIVTRTDEAILDARYSPDGSRLAIAMPNGSINVFDAVTLAKTKTLLGHSDQVTSLCWHQDGKRLGTTSRDKAAKIYDLEAGKSLSTFAGHTGCVNDIAFLDRDEVITVSDDGKASVWSIGDGRKRRDAITGRIPILAVARIDRHYWVASAEYAWCYEVGSNKKLAELSKPSDWVTVVSEGTRELQAFGLHSGEVIIWQHDQKSHSFIANP